MQVKVRNGNILLLLALMVFIACDRDNNNPGYVYIPDMDDSRAYESYTENPVYDDNKTMREPVTGTVPRGDFPYPFEKTAEGMEKAGRFLKNPYSATEEVINRGQEVYNIFCLQCHGEKGDGKGHLVTEGLYAYQPASLIADKAKVKPDGEFFHNITLGFGLMGAHGPMISEEDRWKVVTFIRARLHNQ